MNENLLDNLTKTKLLTDENDWIDTKLKDYSDDIIKLGTKTKLVLAGILAYIISEWLLKPLHMTTIKGLLGAINTLLVFGVPIFLIYMLPVFINAHLMRKRNLMYKDEINKLKEQYNQNLRLLEQYSEVPFAYRYSFAVEIFLNYLNNKRADTLKEAINLFELDRQNAGRLEQLASIQQHQENIMKQVKETKSVAEMTEKLAWINLIDRIQSK